MQFDDLPYRYFGSRSLDDSEEGQGVPGIDKRLVDTGLSRDRAQRFPFWSALDLLGAAPGPEVAFPDPDDRNAARNFLDPIARADKEPAG